MFVSYFRSFNIFFLSEISSKEISDWINRHESERTLLVSLTETHKTRNLVTMVTIRNDI